ncbi:MAG: RNA polymerase sigma factor [Verrucomicrobiales bacterium]|nr:RNA polymerase sigma factor [Verrucomicrobiales bacterium]
MPDPHHADPDADLDARTKALVRPAAKGDEAAWSQLVELLYPNVIAIVRNHLPYSEQEEDITQDIFIKVFMKIEQYAGDKPLTHWVSRIAINTCYDHLRSQRSRAKRVSSYTDLNIDEARFHRTLSAEEPHTAATRSQESTTELINLLLATLNPQEQIVIRLVDLEEHSVAETCELTGWGESKVKVTAMRARRKLTESLADLEADKTATAPDPH